MSGRKDNLERHIQNNHGGGLCAAIESGDQEAVVSCFCGADPQAVLQEKDGDGNTPLAISCLHCHTSILQILLENGAAELSPLDSSLSLWISILGGQHEAAELLRNMGATENEIDEARKAKALIGAVKRGNISFIERYLDGGGDIDITDEQGSTLLKQAVQSENKAMVKLLIERGATNEWTIMDAARDGHVALLDAMLDAKLGPEWHGDHATLLEIFEDWLVWHKGVLHLILGRGLSHETRYAKSETLLHRATKRTVRAMAARVLLRAGANLEALNDDGRTPLHLAARLGNGIAQLLIESGASPNVSDREGNTPLHLAVEGGNLRVVEALLSHGADVKTVTKTGRTPIHMTHGVYHYEGFNTILSRLVDAGSDINHADNNGNTPLHLAFMESHFRFAELLLERGADMHKANKEGKTALDLMPPYRGKVPDRVRAFIKRINTGRELIR
ncbi:hypothetical protein OQA88_8654 [Cercophora sp. LCS_1]